jgi:adenosylhomocysteine nucleosidase
LKNLGIITALLREARCFVKKPHRDHLNIISQNISLLISGIGQQRAEIAANNMLEFGVDSLLVAGTCGGLSPALNPGDIIMPAEIITDTQLTMQVSPAWHHRARDLLTDLSVPIHTQNMLSTGRVISQSVDKARTYNDTNAIAVDMESAAIIKVALAWQVPVLVIKTVIDPADFTIPDFVLKNSNAYGDVNICSLIKSCIVNPVRLGPLLRLAGDYSKSNQSLKLISTQLDMLSNLTT